MQMSDGCGGVGGRNRSGPITHDRSLKGKSLGQSVLTSQASYGIDEAQKLGAAGTRHGGACMHKGARLGARCAVSKASGFSGRS
jgi:hypothetical protein